MSGRLLTVSRNQVLGVMLSKPMEDISEMRVGEGLNIMSHLLPELVARGVCIRRFDRLLLV